MLCNKIVTRANELVNEAAFAIHASTTKIGKKESTMLKSVKLVHLQLTGKSGYDKPAEEVDFSISHQLLSQWNSNIYFEMYWFDPCMLQSETLIS